MDITSEAREQALVYEKEKLRLHFIYCASILGFLAIIIAVDRWTGKANFNDYLTNVATFVSLVLGLVAIIYSFYSNSTLAASLGNITKVSEDVGSTKTEISKFLVRSEQLNEVAEDNTTIFRDVSDKLNDDVNRLSTALAHLKTVVEVIPAKLDSIHDKVSEKILAPQAGEQTFASDTLSDFHNTFLRQVSIAGLWILYAASLAFKRGVRVNVTKLVAESDIPRIHDQYLWGILVSASAAEILDINKIKEPDTDDLVLEIIDISKALGELDFQALAEGHIDSIKSSEHQKQRFLEAFSQLDSLIL